MRLAAPEIDLEQDGEITCFLKQWNNGDPKALEALLEQVYQELKQVARGLMAGENPGRTLSPTALVNEVYIRFISTERMRVENRAQFFWFVGRLMRRILVDYARSRLAARRGSGVCDVPLDKVLNLKAAQNISPTTLLALNEAMIALKGFDERQSRIVEMRFFAGLNLSEISELTGLSEPTIKREWRTARAWLGQRLKSSKPLVASVSQT